jgi:formylglycine-generating enzyme required for sulfatase activity
MGCLSEERDGDCVDNEKPARTDLKVNAFYMGKYEVTNEEFAAFLNAEGNQEERGSEWVNLEGKYNNVKCRIQKDGDRFVVEEGFEKHPMIYVSWYGARAYCKWLSQQTGQNYRLPSEAEWEYAARGAEQGAKDKFLYSGSSTIDKVAWYRDNSGNQTHEVGKQQPNQLGLYDMSGNVWEWCADPWHSNYDNAPKDARVWEEGGNNSYWVLRGGSWVNNSWSCRVATRFNNDPGNRYFNFGFRVARDL